MQNYVQLKSLNTFSISVFANKLIIAHTEYSLLKFLKKNFNNEHILILGEGSNVLFLENYNGTVLLNRIKGIFITEDAIEWKLHVGAGEKWNDLVTYTINRNIPGLENLACIPGCVGAAPIQNIGAYGMEFSQVCEYVDVLELGRNNKIRFNFNECQFKYRSSIFKNYLYKYVIVFVGLKLCKRWKPVLHYPELSFFDASQVHPFQIFHAITLIRKKKLPDPIIHGNAGSFFKNPIIDVNVVHILLNKYPNMPCYRQLNGKIKISAGWLIEHCQLKGYVFGEASVYSKQSLILINNRQRATGTEIAALALYVRNIVANIFNIFLQPEVRFIGRVGEINPKKLFKY